MNHLAEYALLGLTAGGAYGLIALGLIAVHRGTGVINFAQGAVGMVSTYAFWKLFAHAAVPLPAAIAAGIGTGVLVSVLFYALVGRRLVGATTTTRILVTLGLLMSLQAGVRIIWTNTPERVTPFLLPGGTTMLGARVQYLGLGMVLVVAVLTMLLTLLFERTRFGRITTALQDSPMGAQSLGYSPHPWGAAAWAIGGALAAIAGILLAPITELGPTALSSLIVPALGAALIAGFRRFWVAAAVGLAAGIAESLAIGLDVEPGLGKSIPAIVTLIALVVSGRSLPGRGTIDARRLFRVGSGHVSPAGIAIAAAVLLLALYGGLADRWADVLAVTGIFALLGLSVVISTGYAGQVNLLPIGLAGGTMLLSAWINQQGASLPITLLLGVGMAATFGAVIALPTVRTRGVGLTIATLAVAAVIESWVFRSDSFLNGVSGWVVANTSVLGLSFDNADYPQRFALLVWALVLAASLAIASWRRSRAGRRVLAARADERAAAACGVSVGGAKIASFALASALAGAAGVLLALQSGTVGGMRFGEGLTYSDSLAIIAMAVLGGAGYIAGGILAGVFAPGGVIDQLLTFSASVNDWLALLLGLNLTFVLISEPDGVVAQVLRVAKRLASRKSEQPRRILGFLDLPTRAKQDEDSAWHELGSNDPETTGTAPGEPVLRIEGLGVRYGGFSAIEDVSFALRAGEVLGILGPNGAGKSSLVDAITGFVPASGRITVLDADLSRLPPHERARRGLVRTFQDHLLFEDLSVRENLLVAAEPKDRLGYFSSLVRSRERDRDPIAAAAARVAGVEDHFEERVEGLSLGWHARVTVARALAARPRVLLLDEPAAALSAEARRHVTALIRKAAHELNIGVLLIEHNLDVVLDACDEALVLDGGRVLARGEPRAVLSRDDVKRAYLGAPLGETAPPPPPAPAPREHDQVTAR